MFDTLIPLHTTIFFIHFDDECNGHRRNFGRVTFDNDFRVISLTVGDIPHSLNHLPSFAKSSNDQSSIAHLEHIRAFDQVKATKELSRSFRFFVYQFRLQPSSSHITRFTVLGALLGTQNGREVEIVNTFEFMVVENDNDVNEPKFHEFLVSRRDQCRHISLFDSLP